LTVSTAVSLEDRKFYIPLINNKIACGLLFVYIDFFGIRNQLPILAVEIYLTRVGAKLNMIARKTNNHTIVRHEKHQGINKKRIRR
jgi:hypothetical protein